MSRRIEGEKASIDVDAVARFFAIRGQRFGDSNPVVSMLYQDSNPDLAKARDAFEKEKLLAILRPAPGDRVLDLGCGLGRWAGEFQGKVDRYHGTDLVAELIALARKTFGGDPAFSFDVLPAQENRRDRLSCPPPFSLILVAGVLQYLNDADCTVVMDNLANLSAKEARLLVRAPVGVEQRLTLDGIWSEELQAEYSAIYRTEAEYAELFAGLLQTGFEVTLSERLFPSNLNNRADTEQHLFLLQRRS